MFVSPLRIGVYGISGVGKSTLVRALGKYANAIACVDGSAIIDETCTGGLAGFKQMDTVGKYRAREKAVRCIQKRFEAQNRHVVVAGHYSFLKDSGFEIAWTKADSAFYDLIIHLDCGTETHRQRCEFDQSRSRKFDDADLMRWRRFERESLEQLCARENRPFATIDSGLPLDEQIKAVLEIVSRVGLSKAAKTISRTHRKAVVLDCDGTLNDDDVLNYAPIQQLSVDTITRIFKLYQGYCFDAFFAVSQHIDNNVARQDVLRMLDHARASLSLNPTIARALDDLNEKHNASEPIVRIAVSCGFAHGWQNCLGNRAFWLGGASFDLFGCILSDEGKGHFVRELKRHGAEVTCFGNSSSDLPMLLEADYSFYVHTGHPNERHLEKLRGHRSLSLLQLEHQNARHDTFQADTVS